MGFSGGTALTPGFTGADLANLVNEAALAATRRDATAVTLDDFHVAVERIVAGLEKKNRLLNESERRVVAHHEMGHALVASALPSSDPVRKVSIIPRGIAALGYTIQRPTEDRYLMTSDELEDRMVVLLGGRAAEDLVFERVSTGAADDLAKATDMARGMAMRYGMVPELGRVVYDTEPSPYGGSFDPRPPRREYSEETAKAIDHAVRRMLDEAHQRAHGVLDANRALLEESAARLLAEETLNEEQLQEIFARIVRGPPRKGG